VVWQACIPRKIFKVHIYFSINLECRYIDRNVGKHSYDASDLPPDEVNDLSGAEFFSGR
jgi:hypothetical protein